MATLTPSEINLIKGVLLDAQRRNINNGVEFLAITNLIEKMFVMYDETRAAEILASL